MKKSAIFGIFLIFIVLLLIEGCIGGVSPPSTSITGSISGIVTEKGTGTPLSDVSISVDGTPNTTTLSDGSYTITGLTPGFHTLKFEKIGYKTETANVNVVAGTNTPQAAELENTQKTAKILISDDTYITTNSGEVNGAKIQLVFGVAREGYESRILIYFNPSLYLPSNAEIISAKLKLYKSNALGGTSLSAYIYPLMEVWDENYATWFVKINFFPWFKNGGTYDENQLLASTDIPTAGLFDWEEIDITKAFEYWKTHDNYGLIIMPKANTYTVEMFISKDEFSNGYAPYIDVEYYTP